MNTDQHLDVLAIIPARGGSRSIPHKNIYPVAGKPLIVWTIEAALASTGIQRVIVSTDDEEIASVARAAGAETPFMRPKELAEDKTVDLPVFQHALAWLKERENYIPDAVVHLWATSPYRKPGDIDAAIELFRKHTDASCVRSVTTPPLPPFKIWRRDLGAYLVPILLRDFPEMFTNGKRPGEMLRQSLPETLAQTGYLAVISTSVITDEHSMMGDKILPFFHDPDTYTELDSYKDLAHTEYVLKEKHSLSS